MDITKIIGWAQTALNAANDVIPIAKELGLPGASVAADATAFLGTVQAVVGNVAARADETETALSTDDKATLDGILKDIETSNAQLYAIIDAS